MNEEIYGSEDPVEKKNTVNTAKTLNPNNDFKKLTISKPAKGQRVLATSHIEEKSPHYMHIWGRQLAREFSWLG